MLSHKGNSADFLKKFIQIFFILKKLNCEIKYKLKDSGT
jgi:hypothetical protein